jgi:serine/threonine protein phosphatase PrpC
MDGRAIVFENALVEDFELNYLSAGLTHKGFVRPTNQDAIVDKPAARLWAVADGMGGHRDGDVASRMVCQALAGFKPRVKFEDAIDDVRRRIGAVNDLLYAASVRAINPVRSGTTVVAMLAQRTRCAMLWAGDSRAYRLRSGQLTQLTTDHTWAAELNLVEPTGEEVDHAITRAVGGERHLMLDLKCERVCRGDRYLLCSDGLTREVPVDLIADVLGTGDVQQAARTLIDVTLRAGARDNVSVVVIEAT